MSAFIVAYSATAMKILVVDEESPVRQPLKDRLVHEGYDVIEASDGRTARVVLEREAPHLMLLEMRLPDTDGLRILKGVQERLPDLPVIIITASTSINQAVEAMKLGAFDYVAKPFNLDALAIIVKRALELAQLRRVAGLHVRDHHARYGMQNLVGWSRAIEKVRSL